MIFHDLPKNNTRMADGTLDGTKVGSQKTEVEMEALSPWVSPLSASDHRSPRLRLQEWTI
jgi:hypothetical protein